MDFELQRHTSMEESLDKIVQHLEEEARMILPGIQALFGFQLIAVFNQRFTDLLAADQGVHFAALLLTAVSVILVLTPAAYHRQVEPTKITYEFCNLGSRLLTYSLFPLALGTSLDIYLIGKLVINTQWIAAAIGIVAFASFIFGWYLYPQYKKKSKS